MKLTRYEQETHINFNGEEQTATLYTRDRGVMTKLDALVTAYPEVYRCTGEIDIDRTYEIPKTCVTYRKPRKLTKEQREQAKQRMKRMNDLRISKGKISGTKFESTGEKSR